MDPTSKLKTDIICDFKPETMSRFAQSRAGMRIVMTKSNIPKSLWKYYLDAPELWEETEVYDGMKSILLMNSYHNVVPCWMRNATLEDLVRLKLKFTSIVKEKEKYARFAKEVMHNNKLDDEFVEIHTTDLNEDLRNACEQLLTEVNTSTHRESINKDEETFRLHIKTLYRGGCGTQL